MRPAERENQKTRKPENRENRENRENQKTRNWKPENRNTFGRFRVFVVFAVFAFSCFRRFRVFAFSPFSRFSCFRRFRVFAVFASTGWFLPFSRFRVFAFSCSQVLSHVQSWRFRATEWIASVHTLHMPKAVITFVFLVLRNGLLRYIPYACPKLWKRSCSKCYRMDCFGTYFRHAQSCDNVHRVQSATEWTASVHTLRMPKAVITFVFIVLRNGLLRYIPYACPKLW